MLSCLQAAADQVAWCISKKVVPSSDEFLAHLPDFEHEMMRALPEDLDQHSDVSDSESLDEFDFRDRQDLVDAIVLVAAQITE